MARRGGRARQAVGDSRAMQEGAARWGAGRAGRGVGSDAAGTLSRITRASGTSPAFLEVGERPGPVRAGTAGPGAAKVPSTAAPPALSMPEASQRPDNALAQVDADHRGGHHQEHRERDDRLAVVDAWRHGGSRDGLRSGGPCHPPRNDWVASREPGRSGGLLLLRLGLARDQRRVDVVADDLAR